MTRYLVPALAMLVAPTISAYEIDMGEGMSMSIEPRIQSRVEFASASDAAGDDYDIWNKATTEDPQQFNFFMRRTRLYLKGKAFDGFKWNLTFSADNLGRTDKNKIDGNDDLDVRYAQLGYGWKSGDVKHFINFGLDKHTSAMADVDSSSKSLMLTGRLAAEHAGPRSIGIDYSVKTDVFNLRTGLADNNDGPEDLFFYARVASSFKPDWKLKRSESYLGKDGFGMEAGIGFDIAMDQDPEGGDDYTVINLDYLLHYNQWTALAEISLGDDIEGTDVSGMVISAQAGYAMPQENGRVLEPALRIQMVDLNDDDDSTGVLNREGGADGLYLDLGLNYYLNKHKNKLQAGLQIYTPEEGDGDAVVLRFGHQLDF